MTDRERPLRVGIWRAVSSKPQADKISLDDQQDAGERFAASVGGEVVATYTVPGHTRSPYVFWHEAEAEMAAYRQVREDLEAGRLDVIHAVDSDRLGRDAALIAQFESLAQRHGCEIYKASAPHPIGHQTAGHRYLSAIMGVRAQEDSDLRVYRHRMGMKGRIQDGFMAGQTPAGYEPVHEAGEVVGYQLTTDAEAITRMTELFLRGISYTRIATRLIEEGLPTPRGGRWHPARVCHLLADDVYAGYPSWGSYRRRAEDGPSERYPAIWDEETFRAVVAERERRRVPGKTSRHGSGAFSGVARCARCGEPMHHHVNVHTFAKPKVYYYDHMRCGVHATRTHPRYPCHPNYTRRETIVAAVTGWLAEYATPARIDEALSELGEGPGRARIEEEIARAEEAVRQLDRQRERLALALAAGQLDPEMYRRTDDALLVQVDAEAERIERRRRQLVALPDEEDRRVILTQLAADFATLVELADPLEMSSLLQRAGLTIWCEAGIVVDIELG